MKFRVKIGGELSHVPVPDCQVFLGEGFSQALQCAAKFTGAGSRWFPWTRYVYLADGKLYASDNDCLVEIDLQNSLLGPARLSRQDISILQKMGGSPTRASIDGHAIAVAWDDRRWASFDFDLTGIEFVSRCRGFLDQFWHDGAPVTAEASDLQTWEPKAISKVMRFAKSFAPDSSPAPFAFPGGRGLIVRQSLEITEPYQDGLFYHPGGTGIKELTRRVLSGEGFNPYLDDFFALAIKDTKDLLRSIASKEAAALRKSMPETTAFDTETVDPVARLRRQRELIAKYQRGEQLSQEERDLLRPRADLLGARLKKRRKKRGSNGDEMSESLDANQESQRDSKLVALPRDVVEERIERALAPYFEPGFKRNCRVQYWDRLGSLGAITRAK